MVSPHKYAPNAYNQYRIHIFQLDSFTFISRLQYNKFHQ